MAIPNPDSSSSTNTATSADGKHRLNLSLDLRLAVTLLLLIIVGMLFAWKPWSDSASRTDDRTIKVTGEATLKAEPDEYVFSPSYTIQNSAGDRAAALAEMTKRSDELIAKLKALGVSDSQIKTNADSYDRGPVSAIYPEKPEISQPSYTLQLTVTVARRDQAQKVQDYLNTTTPTGTVTPYAGFSTAKRKELEDKARDEATKDARRKADQSAANLDFKLGGVKSVNDGNGFSTLPYLAERGVASDVASEPAPAELSVQPGQNELSYSVTVEYFVR